MRSQIPGPSFPSPSPVGSARPGPAHRRPVVGIIGNSSLLNESYPVHAGGTMNSEAVALVSGCLPLIIPTDPTFVTVEELLDLCDGFLLTGGRPNVHPSEYGEDETPAHGSFERARDAITLPLVRACVERGQPFLGICRGFQEVNVAMGGTLHPEIRDLPGRMNHRMPPDGTIEEKFALRHPVRFTPGGVFHRLMAAEEVLTNTLHGQGIARAGQRIVIDGTAPDGTPEAIYVEGAKGFTLSVQWHPEWNAASDPVSRPLFAAFGAAVRDWAECRAPTRLSA
ncbi:gamma-glutamyl-gamma-aminobutyrate hydrolase family protein [Cereibacter sphaeroides]|uniref:gamma-glutamyl-gamma-aminobutyrate hydrolase family protein n=1 Tax=Cereibacter sphaeroides TaxID=1063 RepID=UPI000F5351E6|nr:gamma-glutamyl-gamma-aminobutyrate hydrolase family protein [Cereibacter sphaeroides]AZB56807.1 gamma-glutamyl-gamma-aminobutyrate hydrolase family protein [Cereibacter sphaeroides]AZB61072.1 gamma-glutamyl-gamma-aminobutyrate hydrolase family protein [Cereibacter sphaeroides]